MADLRRDRRRGAGAARACTASAPSSSSTRSTASTRRSRTPILPYVEDGAVTLIGATTENPSFEVISPLLSRCRVFSLNPLSPEQIEVLLRRALTDAERGLADLNADVDFEALTGLAQASGGDARIALNALEMAAATVPPDENGVRHIGLRDIEEALQQRTPLYDKAGDQHYDIISAFTSPCAAPTPTPPSTGWRACSRPARTRCSSSGGW